MSSALKNFEQLPGSAEAKSLMAWFVNAFDLPGNGEYGRNWGLTVPSKKNGDQLRLNVGSGVAMYLEFADDGWWCFLAMPRVADVETFVCNFHLPVALGPGESALLAAEHFMAVGRLQSVAAMLHDPAMYQACQSLLGVFGERRLPKRDRANDEVAEFVLGMSAEDLCSLELQHHVGKPLLAADSTASPADSDPVGLKRSLSRALEARGIVALVPDEDDADWDLGWNSGSNWTMVNVAVLYPGIEEPTLRNVLGSFLRQYQLHLERPPLLMLFVNAYPTDESWIDLLLDYGITIVAQEDIATWLDEQVVAVA